MCAGMSGCHGQTHGCDGWRLGTPASVGPCPPICIDMPPPWLPPPPPPPPNIIPWLPPPPPPPPPWLLESELFRGC